MFDWFNIVKLSSSSFSKSLTKVWACSKVIIILVSVLWLVQFIMMLRQLCYAIKNQLKTPKATRGISCLSLVLYGLRIGGFNLHKRLVSSILVITVIIKVHHRSIFRIIFGRNMKVSSIKPHNWDVFRTGTAKWEREFRVYMIYIFQNFEQNFL